MASIEQSVLIKDTRKYYFTMIIYFDCLQLNLYKETVWIGTHITEPTCAHARGLYAPLSVCTPVTRLKVLEKIHIITARHVVPKLILVNTWMSPRST